MEAEILGDTKGEVEAEAFFDALAHTLAEIEADNFFQDNG